MNVRVVVADDQALVRDGLRLQLRHAPGLEMVGEASDGEAGRRGHPQAAAGCRPDGPADASTRRHRGDRADHQRPGVCFGRVLVLTTFDLDEYVYAALRAGAGGFLLKDTAPEDLRRAIRVVAAATRCSPRSTRRLIEAFARRPAAGQPAAAVALAPHGPRDARCSRWSVAGCPTPRSPSASS